MRLSMLQALTNLYDSCAYYTRLDCGDVNARLHVGQLLLYVRSYLLGHGIKIHGIPDNAEPVDCINILDEISSEAQKIQSMLGNKQMDTILAGYIDEYLRIVGR